MRRLGGLELTRGGRTALLVCGWCGPLTIVVAFAGWLVAGVLPLPLGPARGAADVAAFYASGVRVPMGIAIASVGVGLVIPLVAGITVVMGRAERGGGRVFTTIQLVAGTATTVCLILPMLVMATAGYRPERPPELTVLLHDLAWLLFLTPIAPFIVQNLAIASLVLTARRPPFARGLAYLDCFVAFSFTFDVLAFAFRTGPFAWNGFLIFWLALTTYAIWLVAMGLAVRRAALDATIREDVDHTDARDVDERMEVLP